jgi:DNA-binding NtrC family response regulator
MAVRLSNGSMMTNANGPTDRILIIDDDPSVHGAIRLALERDFSESGERSEGSDKAKEKTRSRPGRSFLTDSALSGEEGVQMVAKAAADLRPYAMAFVDMRMPPGLDGLQTVTQLWKQFPDLQVVLCTAHCDYRWETLVETLGDTDRLVMLRKPFAREEVLQLAHMFTKKWHRERSLHPVFPAVPDEPFRLLILEDEQLTSNFLERELSAAFPQMVILSARTIAEAHEVQAEHVIDLFLLDMFVPDGSGIDFVFQVMAAQPNARAVMMTGQALGEYRAVAEQSGVLNFLEKPINIPELCEIIQRQIDAKITVTQGAACFAATLTRLSTIDIIQLKCLSQATATLDFVRRDGVQGRIWFERGEIIHAEAPGKKGEIAFAEIVGWRNGRAQEVARAPIRERTITLSWQSLLLNTAQTLDEGAAPEAGAAA